MGLAQYLNINTGEIVITGFDDEEFSLDPEELADEKYLPVDRLESYEAYRPIEDFTVGLPEGTARTKLEEALIRSKPFRHFKDTLFRFPEERMAWFEFKDETIRRVVIRWLSDIEAIEKTSPDRADNTDDQGE